MSDLASIQRAVGAARPKQALALTIAQWELITRCQPLLGTLPVDDLHGSHGQTAGSLLMLASLTSKAACAVHQPLPAQATDAWQHATWPVGDTDLLCMSLVLTAEPQLQALANQFSKEHEVEVPAEQSAGKLQWAVATAGLLLTQLAYSVCKAIDNTAEGEKVEDEEEERQPLGLHPAVVGSLASRVYHLSGGHPQAAMSVLVAAVLPEWQWEIPKAGRAEDAPMPQDSHAQMDGSDVPVAAVPRPKMARSYRKRARSASK